VGFGFSVRLCFVLRSLAVCRVCAIAPSLVSGWRAFPSVALCKPILYKLCILEWACDKHMAASECTPSSLRLGMAGGLVSQTASAAAVQWSLLSRCLCLPSAVPAPSRRASARSSWRPTCPLLAPWGHGLLACPFCGCSRRCTGRGRCAITRHSPSNCLHCSLGHTVSHRPAQQHGVLCIGCAKAMHCLDILQREDNDRYGKSRSR
jgi:hypothetical protein